MFDSIRTIPVRVRPPYDVRIGSGLLGRCGGTIWPRCWDSGGSPFWPTTPWPPLYLDTVTAALEDAGFAVCSHIFPSGEGRKNLSTLTELLEFLASEHLTPHGLRGRPGRRRHWGHGGLCCRRVPPGHPVCPAAHHPAGGGGLLRGGVRPPWT